MDINIYYVYRIIFIILTIWSILKVIPRLIDLIKYKKYLRFLPDFLKKYFLNKGSTLFINNIKKNQHDLIINSILLLIVLLFNIILWNL